MRDTDGECQSPTSSLTRFSQSDEIQRQLLSLAAAGDGTPKSGVMLVGMRSGSSSSTVKQEFARALAAAQAKRFDEATAICDDLLQRDPGLPGALALKATMRAEAGDREHAALLLEQAIALDPTVANWHAQLSGLYQLLSRGEDAVRSARAAVDLDPANSKLLVNLALMLIDIDDSDRAITCLLRAIGAAPNNAEAHLALAHMLLARGELDPGWKEYEWRNGLNEARRTLPRFSSALWNGMKIPGRVLVIGDQGYGDTIQFSRFIPEAAERCTELLVASASQLVPLLAPIKGVASCFDRWRETPPHAARIRLSSLPYVLNKRTEDALAARETPYLKAPAERVEAWKKDLAARLAPGKRVGLAWAGRPTHPNDWRRSMKLAELRPLLDQANLGWVSLQKPIPERDKAEFAQCNALDLSQALADFGETAAVMANLDLVITVDTAVAHLAGALGIPVWVMLPKPADWRWMNERADTPWYPSMRLFRQNVRGDWDKVVADVGQALDGFREEGIPSS